MIHEKTTIALSRARACSFRTRPGRPPAAHRLGAAGALLAAPALTSAAPLDSGDTAWMITATALVLSMTIPGLSLFYAGMVRSKNVLSVFMQCFAITGLISILWAFYAYSLAFDEGNAFVGGLGKAFLSGVTVRAMSGTVPETVFMMFQMTFAIITPALIVGAFAERMKFSAMLVFMALWLTLCYVPVCHWVWGGGWLDGYGILDSSGGTVVHINAGAAGLAAVLALGPRKGYPAVPMPPNNLTYTSSFGIQNDGKSLHHLYHSNSSRMVNTSNWRLRAKKTFTLSSNAVMRVSAQHPKVSPSSSSVSEIIARNRCHRRPAKLNAFNRSCISARTSPMRALSHSNFA